MNDWKVIFYSEGGKCEIQEFIESQTVQNQAKILAWIDMLANKGPLLPRPYADLLIDGIHELRIKLSGSNHRVLYFFAFKDSIYLTHSLIKNTDKVPIDQIKKAKKIRDLIVGGNHGKV